MRLALARGVHPPEPMKHSPPVSEKFVSKSKRKVNEKIFTSRFPEKIKKIPLFSAKISDDLFLVIDHYFRIFRFPDCKFPIYPPISPCSSSFPSVSQIFLHYIFFPPTKLYIYFPPKFIDNKFLSPKKFQISL